MGLGPPTPRQSSHPSQPPRVCPSVAAQPCHLPSDPLQPLSASTCISAVVSTLAPSVCSPWSNHQRAPVSTQVRSCSLPTALEGSQVPQGRNPSPPHNAPPPYLSTAPFHSTPATLTPCCSLTMFPLQGLCTSYSLYWEHSSPRHPSGCSLDALPPLALLRCHLPSKAAKIATSLVHTVLSPPPPSWALCFLTVPRSSCFCLGHCCVPRLEQGLVLSRRSDSSLSPPPPGMHLSIQMFLELLPCGQVLGVHQWIKFCLVEFTV